MPKLLRVALREYKATVKTKGFIIALVLAPILMGGGAIGMAIFQSRVDTTDKVIVLLDHSGRVAEAVVAAAEIRNATAVYDEEGRKVAGSYAIDVRVPASDRDEQLLELSNAVRRGQLHAVVEVGPDVLHPRDAGPAGTIAYYAENPAVDELRSWVARPINDELRRLRLIEAGLDPATIPDAFDWITPDGLRLLSRDPDTGQIGGAERSTELEAVLLPIIPVMVLLMMIMMGASPTPSSWLKI